MTKRCEVYRCAVCGAVVEVLSGGCGTLHCCGQPMERMEEHAKDVGVEKHLPVVEKVEGGYLVKKGDKITQLVVLPALIEEAELVDELEDTERGTGGFGSTGR